MKRPVTLLTSTALLATALTVGLTMAAPQGRDPELHLQAMTQHLNLTETQQAEISKLLEQHRQQRGVSRQALREQVDAVLTDEQRQSRDARIQERIERRVSHMTERLDLTSDQAQQMRDLLAEKRANPSLTRTEMRERVASVLSEDQRAQLEQTRQRRGDRGPMSPR